MFNLDDHKDNLKTGIVMDLYFYTLQFARDNNFTKEKTSAFFSIIKKTHEVCIGKKTIIFYSIQILNFNYFSPLSNHDLKILNEKRIVTVFPFRDTIWKSGPNFQLF